MKIFDGIVRFFASCAKATSFSKGLDFGSMPTFMDPVEYPKYRGFEKDAENLANDWKAVLGDLDKVAAAEIKANKK